MNYKIIENPAYTSQKVGLETAPDNRVLRMFFGNVSPTQLPNLIKAVTQSNQFGVENASLRFYHEMDWEDLEELESLGGIKENELCLYIYDGQSNEVVIPVDLFAKILTDYAMKILEVYEGDKSLAAEWKRDMMDALNLLRKGRNEN